MKRKIFKFGTSSAITISPTIMNYVGLKVNDNIDISFNKKRIIIKKEQ